MMNCRCGLAWA